MALAFGRQDNRSIWTRHASAKALRLAACVVLLLATCLLSAVRAGEALPRSLIVIDGAVSDAGRLALEMRLKPGTEVVILNEGPASLDAVAQVVSRYGNLESLHIVSHGNKGALQLGDHTYGMADLAGKNAALTKIAAALAPGGDILLYGCNIGQGYEGAAFLGTFARLTARDVAASDNQTGHQSKGGDWLLEQRQGTIETESLAARDWQAVLSQNNTGAWTIGTNTASNGVTVGASTVTTTVSFSGYSTATTATNTLTNETLNNIAVFTPAVQATASFGIQYAWDTAPEGATVLASTDGGTVVMTITFSQVVKDPILHLDRIGGASNSQQNAATLTLQTSGVSLTRLSGTGHFAVTGSVISNSAVGTATGSGYTAESNTTTNLGTAAGSVRLNGTFSTVSFLLQPDANALEGTGADVIEMKMTFDPIPVAQPDSFTTYFNTAMSGNLYGDNGSGADSDFNNDTLTVTQVNGSSFTVGSPIALSNGSLTISNATTGAFSFTPAPGFFGVQTFSYTISDANGATSTSTVTITIVRTTITLSKTSLGGVGGFTFTGNNGWSSQTITTATSGTAVSGATQTLAAASTSTTITESIPAGYVVTAISCSGIGTGTATPNLSAGSVTLNGAATAAGNSITCSYTNTRLPTLQISKTSLGAVGGFTFTGNNGWTSQTITTATSGTAVNGTVQTLAAANTATTVTETIPSGYAVTAISCSGLGSGTATPNLAGGSVALNAAATAPGSTVTCSFTNTRLPTLQVRKISNGGVGAFTFSGTNGFGSDSITTVTQGTAANGTTKTLTAANTATTVTESIPSGYFLASITCTGLGAGTATPNLTTGSLTLNASATAPGNTVVCTYTNTVEAPALNVTKASSTAGPVSVGTVITYTFTVTNSGNRPVASIQVAETFNGTGTSPVPANELLLTDAAPSGDSTDGSANDGVWTTLGPGDVVRFTATYTVTQSDIDTLQ